LISKPPFVPELTLEQEIEGFERLKPQLEHLWDVVFPGDEEPYTSVVVPSLTLDQSELAKIPGVAFYEERLLFLLMRLRNPRARMVYVTSQPIHPLVLEYYLQMLAGIPASHARARLTLLCCHDNSPRPLTQKILERPRLLERLRAGIADPRAAYLTVFNVTPLERRLAVLLGTPINGPDPALTPLGSKSGGKQIFREAGIESPDSIENLRTVDEVAGALLELARRKPAMRRAIVKLNESFNGEGNAVIHLPEERDVDSIARALGRPVFSVSTETFESYFEKFERMGGIVEELVSKTGMTSPSCQVRINPRREVLIASTHEQILSGAHGQRYEGCLFPSNDAYRLQIQEASMRIGRALAAHGVVGRFSVDYLAWEESPGSWRIPAIEINLRMGGTTHPMLALRFLTGGSLDERTGLFLSPSGTPKYYRATDNVKSERYRGLLPEDLMDIVTVNRLDYSYRTETGVLFHMIGAISQFGKVGLVAIGNSREEADAIFRNTLEVLDAETRGGS
jgi:hypothetical protein